jgi:hypothetical protein
MTEDVRNPSESGELAAQRTLTGPIAVIVCAILLLVASVLVFGLYY